MSYVMDIPAQVWFLVAAAAGFTLLADAAVRSWKSPERVADPSTMWPRQAPVISDRLVGPRLPSGSFRMPEPGLRLAYGPGGAYFEDTAVHAARSLVIDPVHVGATEYWSPLAEHEAVTVARLPLDDIEEWLSGRLSEYDHELMRIGCRTVSLVRGMPSGSVDEQMAEFVAASQRLHAYRMLRIGDTGEFSRADLQRALASV